MENQIFPRGSREINVDSISDSLRISNIEFSKMRSRTKRRIVVFGRGSSTFQKRSLIDTLALSRFNCSSFKIM